MKNLATQNRKRLAEKLEQGALSIVNSNDIMPSNADGTLKFRQNNDLYWLTGITQEETTLLLFPGHPLPAYREILFVKKTDPLFVKWHGHRLSKEEASALSGIQTILWQEQFQDIFYQAAVMANAIYLNTIEHPRSVNEVQTRDLRFIDWCKQIFPLHRYGRLAPLLASLRMIKSEEEIAMMKQAAAITEAGFRRVLRFVKAGVKEKQIEAEMLHEYAQYEHGDRADYLPIVASGADTCVLHYNSNHKICRDQDLLLIDAAASYRLYNADLTRTIPVNGKFSKRQKEVYNAVLRVHKEMKSRLRAGIFLHEMYPICHELLLEELMGLGLCTTADIVREGKKFYLDKYCYHNFSHLIGLDVHDIGNTYEPLPAGAALTNEPGIYIAEEGIGVRIENNLVLTKEGNMDLTGNIPIEADEIEALMH